MNHGMQQGEGRCPLDPRQTRGLDVNLKNRRSRDTVPGGVQGQSPWPFGPARFALALLTTLVLTAGAVAQPCRLASCVQLFPADSGALNVRDFGAKGDGRTDDTAALIAAVAASGGDTGTQIWRDRVVFLPAGTYLVSDSIVKRYANGGFASGMLLVGEGVDRSRIRLADHAAGFSDRRNPRGVVMTTSKHLDAWTGYDYARRGEGNDAYENFVENLTIDIGSGNPGAIGIDYLANNIGAVRDVDIRAPAGSGAIGIAMLRKLPGPALLQRISIEGFDVGVDVANAEYGVTLSQLSLTGQHEAALRNTGNSVAAEDLAVSGPAAAIVNQAPQGLIVLAGGTFASGSRMANRGTIVFHGTNLPAGAIAAMPSGGMANGWLTGDADWHVQVPAWTLKLPQAPLVDPGPVARWIGIEGQPDGAPPTDSTARVQAALKSGAETIYLRHGTFWISAPLEIPTGVHRILGMTSTIQVLPNRQPGFTRSQGMLRILAPGGPLVIERLAMDNTNRGDQVGIENASSRQLVLRDIMSAGVTTLDRKPAAGAAFLEDTCCGVLHVAGPQPVVARQLNTEGGGVRVVNDGAPLAILGLKTESNCTAVSSRSGARTEISGGLIYMVIIPPASGPLPAFVTEDSTFAASLVEESVRPISRYEVLLQDKQGNRQQEVLAASMPARGFGRIIPMLSTGSHPDGG